MNRQPFLCVPVPGESSWAFESGNNADELDYFPSEGAKQFTSVSGTKRQIDADDFEPAKKQSSDFRTSQTPLCTPSPNTTARTSSFVSGEDRSCVVLCYDDADRALSLRLNDMIEVIGVLSLPCLPDSSSAGGISAAIVSPAGDIMMSSGWEDFDNNIVSFEAEDIGGSLMHNRIHALLIRKIASAYPLNLKRWDTSVMTTTASSLVDEFFGIYGGQFQIGIEEQSTLEADAVIDAELQDATSRNRIIFELTSVLGGDARASVAAKHITLALLSRLYRRSNSRTAEDVLSCPGPLSSAVSLTSFDSLFCRFR